MKGDNVRRWRLYSHIAFIEISFKHLLSTYSVSDTILGARNIVIIKTKFPYILLGEREMLNNEICDS